MNFQEWKDEINFYIGQVDLANDLKICSILNIKTLDFSHVCYMTNLEVGNCKDFPRIEVFLLRGHYLISLIL